MPSALGYRPFWQFVARKTLLLLFVLVDANHAVTQQAAKPSASSAQPIANFIDIAEKAGLTMSVVFGGVDSKKYIIETTGTGVAIFDYDNDGWPDIFVADGHIEDAIEKVQKRVSYAEPPHLFHNLGGGKFEEVTAKMGKAFAAPKVARGAAYADIDNDGFLDVLITANGGPAYLFHNEDGSNRSLRVKLVGTKSNRDGIGAVVRVTAGADKQWQMLRSGSSYLSQSELVLTFGLGTQTKAEAVEVQWPSGEVDKLSGVKAEQTITVQEGKGVVAVRPYKPSLKLAK